MNGGWFPRRWIFWVNSTAVGFHDRELFRRRFFGFGSGFLIPLRTTMDDYAYDYPYGY